MNTILSQVTDGRRRRRQHSDEFKANAVAACLQAGVSMAAVAMAHGVNVNLLRRWVKASETAPVGEVAEARALPAPPAPSFVPLQLPPPAAAAAIRIELRRGATAISVTWPGDAAAQCAAWMRELLRVIRIDAIWLAVEPADMRAGADRLLARVVQVFGSARAHHGYLFANARATRVKLVVHDGFGVWCATRRLNQGRFVWPSGSAPVSPALTRAQFEALVLGLPWQRLEQLQAITRM